MKKIILAVSLLSFSAFANDTSIPVIEVQSIDPGTYPIATDWEDRPNKEVKFYGGDVNEVFNALPASKSVLPEEDIVNASKFRTLTIQSAGNELELWCTKVGDGGEVLLEETECGYVVARRFPDEEGDGFDHKADKKLPASTSVRGILPGGEQGVALGTTVTVKGKNVADLNAMLTDGKAVIQSPRNSLTIACSGKEEDTVCTFKVERR